MTKRIFISLSLLLTSFYAFALAHVDSVKIKTLSDKTQIEFLVSEQKGYEMFTLENPARIVLDLKKALWKTSTSGLEYTDTGVSNIRFAPRPDHGLRIVIDMPEDVPAKASLTPLKKEKTSRLLVEIQRNNKDAVIKQEKSAFTESTVPVLARDFIIAIDPGHGGADPGAVGKHYHTYEKDIVLKVGTKLMRMINHEPGMKAFLTRDGDYYVGLRKRMQIARKRGADLFVSIHADSFSNTTARGASVFVLSEHGASNEAARWLAEKENRADLIGGVSLDDKGDMLASVLLDLSQTANQTASEALADKVLRGLNRVTDLHSTSVQRAGFLVLKSPDVPSILVELGFLSNPAGEKLLRSESHQTELASAVLGSVKNYLKGRPHLLTPSKRRQTVAMTRHKVKKGENLSLIARKYGIPTQQLVKVNKLKTKNVMVGQTLTIPEQGRS